MVSIDRARENWERKTRNAGNKWKDAVQGRQGDYERGVAEFLGVDEAQVTTGGRWNDGVNSVSAGEFQQSVDGKGDKWERNVRRGLTE